MPIVPTNEVNINKHYLYPGKIFSSKKPHVIDTILGSCVAVFLWDPVLQFGCVNHFMLPFWNKGGDPSFKYGNVAIPELITRMQQMGSNKKSIKAKIFGGSGTDHSNDMFNIGRRNIILAKDLLRNEKIPIVSWSVGGTLSRKVIFYSASGDVLISYIKQDTKIIDHQNSNSKFNFSVK